MVNKFSEIEYKKLTWLCDLCCEGHRPPDEGQRGDGDIHRVVMPGSVADLDLWGQGDRPSGG